MSRGLASRLGQESSRGGGGRARLYASLARKNLVELGDLLLEGGSALVVDDLAFLEVLEEFGHGERADDLRSELRPVLDGLLDDVSRSGRARGRAEHEHGSLPKGLSVVVQAGARRLRDPVEHVLEGARVRVVILGQRNQVGVVRVEQLVELLDLLR